MSIRQRAAILRLHGSNTKITGASVWGSAHHHDGPLEVHHKLKLAYKAGTSVRRQRPHWRRVQGLYRCCAHMRVHAQNTRIPICMLGMEELRARERHKSVSTVCAEWLTLVHGGADG